MQRDERFGVAAAVRVPRHRDAPVGLAQPRQVAGVLARRLARVGAARVPRAAAADARGGLAGVAAQRHAPVEHPLVALVEQPRLPHPAPREGADGARERRRRRHRHRQREVGVAEVAPEAGEAEGTVWVLEVAAYGLAEAPKSWNKTLDTYITNTLRMLWHDYTKEK